MENLNCLVRVEEHQVVAAMKVFENRAGPRDGITICREVSALADVLGVMWHEKVKFVELPADDKVLALLADASAESIEHSKSSGEDDDDSQAESPTTESPAP